MNSPDERTHDRKQSWGPLWLPAFLQITFFGSCTAHTAQKNEQKRYCINCELPACLHCIAGGSHAGHEVLKICRYAFQDAVQKNEMKKNMDCSDIQAFICNKELILTLNPIPHRGLEKCAQFACVTCMRKLMDHNKNRYCSLACKLEAFSKEENESDATILEIQSPSPPQEQNAKRSRKGIPRRASFF